MTDTTSRDLFPGALEMMILESLRRQPAHGYALVLHIQQRSNNLLQVEEGSLYPALHRMEQEGWIAAEWGLSENNRRARFYRLTPQGRKQLRTERENWQKVTQAVDLVLNFGTLAQG